MGAIVDLKSARDRRAAKKRVPVVAAPPNNEPHEYETHWVFLAASAYYQLGEREKYRALMSAIDYTGAADWTLVEDPAVQQLIEDADLDLGRFGPEEST